MLLIKSIISTTSSSTSKMQKAKESGVSGLFRCIGAGSCGRVYEELGTSRAMKFSKPGYESQLWNDYKMHTRVLEAFNNVGLDLHIPKVRYYVEPKSDGGWWEKHAKSLPMADFEKTPDVLCMQRILPIPKLHRDALIEQWCPDGLQYAAKAEPSNADCLIRVYLGANRRPRTRPLRMFQLRNFNLYLDQIKELSQVEMYEPMAESMGQALAIMHWKVGIDARDVEFVLGSASTTVDFLPVPAARLATLEERFTTWHEVEQENVHRRAIRLWMLDFNQCRNITPDEAGIKTAVDAFFINDPYFPRPLRGDAAEKLLWSKFAQAYRVCGKVAIGYSWRTQKPWKGDVDLTLPDKFIDACIAGERERIQKRRLAEERVKLFE
jgi:hypothetical protein